MTIFEACQPLNFIKFIEKNGFVLTNYLLAVQ